MTVPRGWLMRGLIVSEPERNSPGAGSHLEGATNPVIGSLVDRLTDCCRSLFSSLSLPGQTVELAPSIASMILVSVKTALSDQRPRSLGPQDSEAEDFRNTENRLLGGYTGQTSSEWPQDLSSAGSIQMCCEGRIVGLKVHCPFLHS